MNKTDTFIPASFRDPSGFLFWQDGDLYRQVNFPYQHHYNRLMQSGLYEALIQSNLLIPHEEVFFEDSIPAERYKVLRPKHLSFISYPYEWCFSQLKKAALVTLEIQNQALRHGMVLKDASAYNVQFHLGTPIFIDTLSFETYVDGHPWIAYRQFCQHFLAPLALMAFTDIRLNQMSKMYLDGIPLDMTSRLLPSRTYFRLGLLTHIHLHAKAQKRFESFTAEPQGGKSMRKSSLHGLIESLESTISRLTCDHNESAWSSYYEENNYSQGAMAEKIAFISEVLDELNPRTLWDLGANTGFFSRLAAEKGIETVSIEADPSSADINYRTCVEKGERRVLPLIQDLSNPSPGIGWLNEERSSLFSRGPAEAVLALALIHHLAISNNVPLERIADCFWKVCTYLIIEFVPKSDSQVQRLLATRDDIFPHYTQTGFEQAFNTRFTILKSMAIPGSERTLYLMQKH